MHGILPHPDCTCSHGDYDTCKVHRKFTTSKQNYGPVTFRGDRKPYPVADQYEVFEK